jgi:hypothetical protein
MTNPYKIPKQISKNSLCYKWLGTINSLEKFDVFDFAEFSVGYMANFSPNSIILFFEEMKLIKKEYNGDHGPVYSCTKKGRNAYKNAI